MKRTFGKNLVLFILIVLFTLCMAVGCTTLNVKPVAENDSTPVEYNAESSITLESSRKTILQKNEFTLTVTAKLKNDDNHDKKWGAAEFYIKSTLATASEDFELIGYEVPDVFKFATTHSVTMVDSSLGFVKFVMSSQSDNLTQRVDSTYDLVVKLNFKYKDGAALPTDNRINFNIESSTNNFISSYDYKGTAGGGTDKDMFSTGAGNLVDKTVGGSILVETVKPSNDKTLKNLVIIENLDGEDETRFPFTIRDTENPDNVVLTGHNYITANASKDNFYILAEPNNATAEVKLTIAGKVYEPISAGSSIYKIPLTGGAGTSGTTEIQVDVTSYEDITSNTPNPATYYVSVKQIYLGLDATTSITTNESVSATNKGLSEDTKIEDYANEFDILVPTGTDGATKVDINAVLASDYGIKGIKSITDTNCTSTRTGNKISITGIGADAKIVVELENNAGIYTDSNGTEANTEITFNLKQISVETGVQSFTADYTYGMNVYQLEDKEVAGKDFTFHLPKESGYAAKANVKLVDGATYKLMLGSAEAENTVDGDIKTYTLKEGEYTLVVTAAAGNTKTYTVSVKNEILAGQIVSFEYRLKETDPWVHVYDKLNGHVDSTDTEFNYGDAVTDLKDAFKFFQLNVNINAPSVQFKIAITDKSSLSGIGSGTPATGDDVYGDYETKIYTINDIKVGNNKKTISVAAQGGAGSNSYPIEIVKTEDNYGIKDITFDYTGRPDSEILVDFDKDFPAVDGSNIRNYKKFGDGNTATNSKVFVKFKTSQVTITIKAEGMSTVVYINGVRMARTSTESTDAGDFSYHTYVLNLRESVDTPLKITYEGTDGLKTSENDLIFNIPVRRNSADSENKLETLTVDLTITDADGSNESTLTNINIGFTADNLTPSYQLPEGKVVKSISISAKAFSAEAQVNGTGVFDLTNQAKTGKYVFNVTVVPENSKYGSNTKTYKITIHNPDFKFNQDATLSELSIFGSDGVDYAKGKLSSASNDISIEVPYKVNGFNYVAIPTAYKDADGQELAKVSVEYVSDDKIGTANNDGLYSLVVGEKNVLRITVNAEDTSVAPNIYTITIKRAQSVNNTALTGISIFDKSQQEVALNVEFDKDKTDYKVKAGTADNFNDLSIQAIAEEDNAVVTLTTGTTEVKTGDKEVVANIEPIPCGESRVYKISVEIDGYTRVYTVEIERESKEPYLEDVKVTYNGNTQPLGLLDGFEGKDTKFDKDVTEYWVKLGTDVTSVTIVGVVPEQFEADNNISDTYYVSNMFTDENDVFFAYARVNGNGQTKTYKFNIIKADDNNSNTNIKLNIAEVKDFVMNNNKDYYEIVVPFTTAEVSLSAEAEIKGAKITINGIAAKDVNRIDLQAGENVIRINVTAVNGKPREIELHITRKDAAVQSITAKDKDGNTITNDLVITDDINKYTMTVGHNISEVNFAVNIDPSYSTRITNNTNLENGKATTVKVEIVNKAGQVVRTIEIDVFREQAPANFTMWYIIAGVLGAIALILLIVAIIAFTKGGGSGSKRRGNINDIGIGDYELD